MLSDLPDEALAHAASYRVLPGHAASYLVPPSRAMFGVVLTAPSSSWRESTGGHVPSAASRAVMDGDSWETLDFEDIEEVLARRLTDKDVFAILRCIDAKSKLKKLKLAGCASIIGDGLEPLPI